MRRILGVATFALLIATTAAFAAQTPPPVSSAPRPLATAVYMDTGDETGPYADTAMARVAGSGAHFVRFSVYWNDVAPAVLPATFDPANPADPAYDWSVVDAKVKRAVTHGLQPYLTILEAPSWATSSATVPNVRPDPQQLALFAKAIATRYSGSFEGLPRVRYWQVWNEPNLSVYLSPQFDGTTPVSPTLYRAMANAFAAAVHGVHADNFVIAGGLAPYGSETPAFVGMSPLTFTRNVLCMSADAHPQPTCNETTNFDAWGMDPYTWGGPTHQAANPNDVAAGDLGRLKALLDAAVAAHHVRSSGAVQLWVTEFGWDTSPPDPNAVPIALQARWTSEALYYMWKDGVSVVTWFLLRDEAYPALPFQTGLYFAGPTLPQDKPKPTLTAFRFPFVAELHGKGFDLWGRTPTSTPANVVVEQSVGGAWKRIATLHADRFGIFQGRWNTTRRAGLVRARLVGSTTASLPFGLKPVPDTRYPPFG